MAKKLIIFCGGAWNELTARGANILRILRAIESADVGGANPQHAHSHPLRAPLRGRVWALKSV